MAIKNFVKAKRENLQVLFGLAGESGAGKTYSAMTVADALSGDDPFFVIDTERRRALHYADHFDFEHTMLDPPFEPAKYLETVRKAASRGFGTIVIDSMSHVWEGEGGVLEMAQREKTSGIQKWLHPKMAHRRMMGGLLQSDVNLIFCLRARQKIKQIVDPNNSNKTVWQYMGYSPICEKSFMNEMTVSFTLDPENPGAIDLRLPNKLSEDFRPIFTHGQHITKESCEQLAAWAKGADIQHPNRELWRRARIAANVGKDALREFVEKSITEEEKIQLRPIGNELNRTAREADKNREMEEDHFDYEKADQLDMMDLQTEPEVE